MDLIYKIYSVYLYDDQLKHDYLFLYNKTKGYIDLRVPYDMFGGYSTSASNKIFRMDKSDPNFKPHSIQIMESAAKKNGIPMIKSTDFITLVPLKEGHVSYSGIGYGEIIKEGKYAGLRKQVYTPYDILWNETKSGINIHEYDVAGIWNIGSSSYSAYRIWEYKKEREIAIRDYKIKKLGI